MRFSRRDYVPPQNDVRHCEARQGRGNLLCREGNILESKRRNLPACTAARICSSCNKVVPKLDQVSCNQHLAHRMCYLTLAECKAFYSKRKISSSWIAVASVESGYKNTVAAMLQNIFQRYAFFCIRQCLSLRYVPESEEAGKITFRFKDVAGKISKMYEDKLTLTRTPEGYELEGLRKDVLRLATGLEHRLNPNDGE